jgi:tetratricopeptide (TPR) repeat protein
MAIASFYKDELDKAEQYFLLALSYREKTGNHFFMSESEHNLGSFYQASNNTEKAIIHFERALKIAKQGGIKSGESDAYQGLSEVYESLKDFKKQVDFLKKKIEIDHSIFNEKSSKELSLLRISYQNERDQIEALSKKREQILESRINSVYSAWDIWIWVIIGCLVVLIIALLLNRKSKVNRLN